LNVSKSLTIYHNVLEASPTCTGLSNVSLYIYKALITDGVTK